MYLVLAKSAIIISCAQISVIVRTIIQASVCYMRRFMYVELL